MNECVHVHVHCMCNIQYAIGCTIDNLASLALVHAINTHYSRLMCHTLRDWHARLILQYMCIGILGEGICNTMLYAPQL